MDGVRSFFRRVRAALTGVGVPACLGLLTAAGCVTPSAPWAMLHGEIADEPPCRLACSWDRNVRVTQNCVDGGSAVPGLAGRLYFFTQDQKHLTSAHGKVVAEWYDAAAPAGTNPQHFRVEYAAADLQKMKREDWAGVGYTVFLPWPDYRPNITRVRLHVCFMPEKGGFPLYADPVDISLQGDSPISSHQTVVPVAPAAPVPPPWQPGMRQMVPPGLELRK
jgi:hypothetical protein